MLHGPVLVSSWCHAWLESPGPPWQGCAIHVAHAAGFVMTQVEVERAQAITAAAGAWLVLDNTYEHFLHRPGDTHYCMAAPNTVNIFSFSKAYGMMGWRVGYIAYPDDTVSLGLGADMLKVQDTIPICPTQVSQKLALEALSEGRTWVTDQVAGLQGAQAPSWLQLVSCILGLARPDCFTHLTACSVQDSAMQQRLMFARLHMPSSCALTRCAPA
jgi:Aminotransferase class I and II